VNELLGAIDDLVLFLYVALWVWGKLYVNSHNRSNTREDSR